MTINRVELLHFQLLQIQRQTTQYLNVKRTMLIIELIRKEAVVHQMVMDQSLQLP